MIYLMRHGAVPQVEPRRFVGQRDLPLSREGRTQAARAGEALARVAFVRAIASGLARTMETARLVVGERNLEVEAEPRLREISLGEWEGLTVSEVRERFPGQYEARGRDMAGFRPPGGESFRDLAARTRPVLEELAQGQVGPVLVMAHAGVNRVLLCAVLGMPLENLFRIEQDYACLNLLSLAGREPVVRGLNLAF